MAYTPIRLAENIILLNKLCKKPIEPTRNELKEPERRAGRKLRKRQELEITSCLAYLAAYSNVADHVMALSVEEQHEPDGLTISFATNSGPSEYLQAGLQKFAKVLERQNKGPIPI